MTFPVLFSHYGRRMDSLCHTTQFLERLSTDELFTLAEKHGLDIPPDIERVFIIEELLYLDRDSAGNTEENEENPALVKQNSISVIEVLVRDPMWAFAFWEIKGQDKELYGNDDDFNGYCLRVVPIKEGSNELDMAASFTVAVGKNDSAWYLGFPPDDRRFFKVELCVSNWEDCIVLAASQPFRMPRLIEPRYEGGEHKFDGEIQAVYRNPLAQLSGVEHFSLLRNMDRPLRPREA